MQILLLTKQEGIPPRVVASLLSMDVLLADYVLCNFTQTTSHVP